MHCINVLFFSRDLFISTWDMNTCCLIMLHVDMLTLFLNSLTKEQMSIQRWEQRDAFVFSMWKQPWFYGVISIRCTIFNFLFILNFFINHKLYELVYFLQLCKYYVRIICTKCKREPMWKHVMSLIMIQWKWCVLNTKQDW